MNNEIQTSSCQAEDLTEKVSKRNLDKKNNPHLNNMVNIKFSIRNKLNNIKHNVNNLHNNQNNIINAPKEPKVANFFTNEFISSSLYNKTNECKYEYTNTINSNSTEEYYHYTELSNSPKTAVKKFTDPNNSNQQNTTKYSHLNDNKDKFFEKNKSKAFINLNQQYKIKARNSLPTVHTDAAEAFINLNQQYKIKALNSLPTVHTDAAAKEIKCIESNNQIPLQDSNERLESVDKCFKTRKMNETSYNNLLNTHENEKSDRNDKTIYNNCYNNTSPNLKKIKKKTKSSDFMTSKCQNQNNMKIRIDKEFINKLKKNGIKIS